MKNFVSYASALFVLNLAFFPVPGTAQKNKTVDAKSIASKTDSKAPAPKQDVLKPAETSAASAMAQTVLDEINVLRREPKKYVQYLEDYKKLFKGNTVYMPGYLRLETREGVVPVDEAISFLKTLPQLKAYNLSDGMGKAANLQLGDLSLDSKIGHTGRDGSNILTRLQRFGSVQSLYAENISYIADNARDIVLAMLIDDGVKNRMHRLNLLSPTFKIVGIAYAPGKNGQNLCVITFADGMLEKSPKSGVREF